MRAFDLEAKRHAAGNGHHHEHHPSVQTVSFVQPGDLNKTRLSHWFRSVLAEQGADILRMKGILNMHGDSHQFVFHGVHSMFEGRLGREWGEDEERLNRLVFIGRDLDGEALQSGLKSCLRSENEAATHGEMDIYREVSSFTLDQIRIWVRQALEFPVQDTHHDQGSTLRQAGLPAHRDRHHGVHGRRAPAFLQDPEDHQRGHLRQRLQSDRESDAVLLAR